MEPTGQFGSLDINQLQVIYSFKYLTSHFTMDVSLNLRQTEQPA